MPSPSHSLDRVLVTGANGQLGRALIQLLGPHRAIAATRDVLNLEFAPSIPARLGYFKPTAVINAGAYTAVDKAESDEQTAMWVNAEAPAKMAEWCAAHDVPFIHFSTDYVFNGEGDSPRTEDHSTNPLNVYGRTKLEGERQIEAVARESAKQGRELRYLIFRTSWVYDGQGKNFLNTMLKLGAERETLKVVSDQIGAPTYAPHLADATLQALENACSAQRFPSGIYHLCNTGETSWHGFASAIFDEARAHEISLKIREISPILSSEYPTPARRPLNSRLDCNKALEVLKVRMPDWRTGLSECMDLLSHKITAPKGNS